MYFHLDDRGYKGFTKDSCTQYNMDKEIAKFKYFIEILMLQFSIKNISDI